MKAKKITALVLSLIMVFSVASCNKDTTETSTTAASEGAEIAQASNEDAPTTNNAGDSEPVETEPLSLYDENNELAINPVTGVQDMDPENVGKRPVAVVMNNHYASLPQRGISQADIIYEYETEGGQTRLLCLFADVNKIPEIGSIRSARILSSDLAASSNAIFIHYGRNARVPDHISEWGIDHIDGNTCSASYYTTSNYEDNYVPLSQGLFFYRENEWPNRRDTEHTAVTDGRHIKEAIEYFNINDSWDLAEGEESPYLFNWVPGNSKDIAKANNCDNINVYFSATNDDAFFEYDPTTKLYYKSQYGIPQIDMTNDEQVAVTNVLVIYADILMNGDKYTIDAYLQSGGCGYYVSNGKIMGINWTKPTPNDPFTITNADGEEVEINRGKTYVCVVRSSRMGETTINLEK